MTENERVAQIRKKKSLSMESFGEKIGVTKSAIGNIESGRRGLTTQVAKAICREFNVSEKWLRTGEGQMMVERSGEEEIQEAIERLMTGEKSKFKKRLLMVLSNLEESEWIILEKRLHEILDEKEKAPALTPEQEIEEKVANYRKQLLEEKNTASQDFSRNLKDADGKSESA